MIRPLLALLASRRVARRRAVRALGAVALTAAGVAGGLVAVLLAFPTVAMIAVMGGVFALVVVAGAQPLKRRGAYKALRAEASALGWEIIAWVKARQESQPQSPLSGGLRERVNRYSRRSPAERAEDDAAWERYHSARERHDSETLAWYYENYAARAMAVFEKAESLGLVGTNETRMRTLLRSPETIDELLTIGKYVSSFESKARTRSGYFSYSRRSRR